MAQSLHYVLPTFSVGGAQRRFAAVASALCLRYSFGITALDGNYGAASLFSDGVQWKCVPFHNDGRDFLKTYAAARRQLRSAQSTTLVTNNWGAIEWAAANLPKLVRHVHIEDGFGPEEAHGQLLRRVWFRRLVLRWHSAVVLPSLTLLGIARDVWQLPERCLHYVPNGIPCAKFDRAADAALAAKIVGTGPVIGTVAALRKEKALDRLIHAFAMVRKQAPARLAIVGEGGERPGLEALVHSLGLAADVTFLGHMGRPEDILSAFDIFALSSDTEQMPLTVLEAMAAGLPVAGVDVGDVKHMVGVENRRFIGPVDAAALAASMAGLAVDSGLRRHIGVANRVRARTEYEQDGMFEAYDRLFSGVN